MKIQIRRGDIHLVQLRTRLPFKYGIATMTDVPQAFVRLWVEVGGQPVQGIASDLLPPKWFTKDPAKPIAEEVAEMLRVIQNAVTLATGLEGETAFDLWHELYGVQARWGAAQHLPPLLTHFGTSLVERALIEAVCRAFGRPFARLLHSHGLGLRLGEIHDSLRGKRPSDYLSPDPLKQVIARHTVGLADPLLETDIPDADRLHDGLPQSLEACIRAYGLRHFKIKVTGHLDHDLKRLGRLAEILRRETRGDFAFSLDGNEQFKSLVEFRDYWEVLQQTPSLKDFLCHLLFVEQPLHRAVALAPDLAGAFRDWPERPSVIIDESDADLSSLPTALQLGYAGTSHKNCKGIFKGIANRCLLLERQAALPRSRLLMSGEDLCNIGPVALLQDLAVMVALGIESVERNGHHYCAGLSMFPPTVQQQVLSAHADLYQAVPAGWPTLKIEAGTIQLASLNQAPLGVGFVLDVEQFMSADQFGATA
ncbi:MAG: hypothetical protein HY674_06310 [Chloroflexi bacterium]|nr:hypothetical protein [Chloroflexota bacterium]